MRSEERGARRKADRLLDLRRDGAVDGLVLPDLLDIPRHGEARQVELPEHGRDDVGVLQVVVVAGAIEVGRHGRAEVGAILPVVGLAHLDAGDLGDGVGLVGRLQDTGEEVLLAHGLGRELRIDAGGAQEEEVLHPGLKRFVDDVGLDHQVLVDELGRIGVVGEDAAHLGRGQHHVVHPFPAEELPHRLLVGQIEFPMGAGDDSGAALILQPPDNGRPHHAPVAGDIYFRVRSEERGTGRHYSASFWDRIRPVSTLSSS